ncbi:MAG: serine/threonine-protein kinase [Planctomycetota bacterium]
MSESQSEAVLGPQNAEAVFAQALELPAEARLAFVNTTCFHQPDLQSEVEQLLGAHSQNEGDQFLNGKPLALLREGEAEISEGIGNSIGRYKLLEEIGEGGMGVVYMAEQIEDVRRRVALKVIKLGMDTRQVIARFEAERQAMALFDHPNITSVLDAGVTSAGRPYFVMELVRGLSITEFARSHQLSEPERLELFIQVCDAIQHAHQKGIIHRDIKPSNVMVTLNDGKPLVKVIDFGIAKAVGHHRLTEKTLFTRYSAMVGTPHYMSPEQAELNGRDVDTRSDIYSLGVILYELLTGTTPLSRDKLKQVSPLALHETLRDADIETPSDRIRRLSKEATTDSPRVEAAHPSRARPKKQGELDWVVMKALSRDRQDRYASVHELARDVECFLRDEPVQAAPPSRLRATQAFYRRNRKSIATAATFGLILVVCSLTCVVFGLQAVNANRNLVSTNSELSAKVQELKIAKEKLREATSQQLYDNAISVALAKFTMDMEDEITDLIDKLFPGYFAPVENEADLDFQLCFTFDPRIVLDLQKRELLKKSLARIERVFDQEDEFYEQLLEDEESEDVMHGEEHSPECFRLQEATNRKLPEHRHKFYRKLVAEFRKTFGEDDPRVAEALQLFAVSLAEVRRYSEAEARLREALAIGDEKSRECTRQLMRNLNLLGTSN